MNNKNGKWMGSKKIAAKLGISRRAANKKLSKLRQSGGVEIRRRITNGGIGYEYWLPTGWESRIWSRDAAKITETVPSLSTDDKIRVLTFKIERIKHSTNNLLEDFGRHVSRMMCGEIKKSERMRKIIAGIVIAMILMLVQIITLAVYVIHR